jgi:hypothetical protein
MQMSKRFDENRIRELVRLGSRAVSVPARTEARVLAAIRERTHTRKHTRRSLFTLVRYQPAFGLAALAIVLVPLVVVAGSALFGNGEASALLVASAKGGSLAGRPDALRSGERIAENSVIRTGPGEQTALESSGRLSLQLFSNSEIRIGAFNTHRAEVSLHRGSLYLQKHDKADAAGRVSLSVDAYVITLKGTRIFAAIDERRRITLLCFDGLLEAAQAANGVELFILAAGGRAVIEPDGTWRVAPDGISEDEKALDAELKDGLPRDELIKELAVAVSARNGNNQGPAPEAGDPGLPPPYDITVVGSIAARGAAAGEVAFYAVAGGGGRMFLINREQVFTLDHSGLQARPGLVPESSFRVRPVSGGKYIAFSTAVAVTLVDAVTLRTASAFPLPAEGTIDHNFTPYFDGNLIYIPVQNLGYYRTAADNPASFTLLAREPFPVTPCVRGGTVYIGSYYSNFWSGVTAEGKTLFRTALKGNGFANAVPAGNGFYLYQAEGERQAIIRLDETGRETGRYPLAHAMSADFIAAGETLCGIDTEGTLFMVDTRSGRTTAVKKLFRKALSTRQWRNAGLALAGRLVYAPTDDHTLIVADTETKIVMEEIDMPGSEAFYTAPFFFGNTLYAVSNAGTVFRIVKNER